MQPWEWHPAIVHFPLAFLVAAAALEAWRGLRGHTAANPAVASLLVAGAVTGVLAAVLGVLAYYTVPVHTPEAHGRMLWHLRLGVMTVALAAPMAWARWRSRSMPPAAWMRAGTLLVGLLIGVTGYLGGHLVLRGGAGVDPSLLAAELREGHIHVHGPSATPSPPRRVVPLGAPVRSDRPPRENAHEPGAPAHTH